MFDRTKHCKSHKMMIRLNNFLYVFNLRQGTILIAVHQIALSSFILIILLVGISHVGEMLSMLHSDMEDDAERRGLAEAGYGEQPAFREGAALSTNNQRRFAKAQHLASVTVIFLYTSTVLTAAYLACCVSLLHGAVRRRRAFVLPWLAAACAAAALLLAAAVAADGYPCLVDLFGGHHVYHVGCALFVLTFVYAICAVGSFALELPRRDERGERLLLLDHAAHCSLLSAAQLAKLARGSRTHFV